MTDFLTYVIADYGHLHDLAFAEVTQKLYTELGCTARIRSYSVPPFDTVATGFVLAQLAVNSKLGTSQKFYVNTAPRKDDLKPRVKNSGEGFAYVKLKNGIEIAAVNSGYSLSFLKDAAEEIREINCAKEGSQFRSRDVFPPAFAKVARGDYSQLGADLTESVPSAPDRVICYTDGYGNMKISVSPDELKGELGKDVVLEINGRQRVGKITDGIFGVSDGQLCLAPGSSGWTLPNGKEVRFAEISLRGGNAAKEFGRPPGGIQVSWRDA